MSWCCGNKRDGSNMASGQDNNELTADDWRNRERSKEENENDGTIRRDTHPRSISFEQLQNQMDPQHPLQKAYEIHSREIPLNPKQGDILHPTLSTQKAVHQNPSRNAKKDNNVMEIFRPEVSTGWSQPIQFVEASSNERQGNNEAAASGGLVGQRQTDGLFSERITSIDPTASEDFLDNPPSPKSDPSALQFPQRGSLLLAPRDEDRRKSDPLPHNNRKRSGKDTRRISDPIALLQRPKNNNSQDQKRNVIAFGKTKTKRRSSYKDEDHLSDVPSDVDSVNKDRYLLACQLLKNVLVQKEKILQPLEREFLLSLLGDYEIAMDETSVISEDHISAVEQATLRLENDPIFQKPDDTNNNTPVHRNDHVSPPSAMAAAARQLQENFQRTARRSIVSTKHPPTATRAKPKGRMPFLSNPCNPKTLDDVGSPADIVLIIREEDDQDDPEYSDDDSTERNAPDTHQMIRFDGWSSQKSAEYPFLILGADDHSQLKPRVLTPSNMEALRGFFPYSVSESNFWLKFSMVRDGASLSTLLSSIRASTHAIIGVETKDGEVFGSFTGTPWRIGQRWYGKGESFLWRLKKPRFTSARNAARSNFENKMEVYPYTGYDDLVQYCTAKTIAVGGGDWIDSPCPFPDEPRGIGFMIDGDLVGGETNSCATFANPRLCRKTSASNEFAIINLEVWTLTPCTNVIDAAKMEIQKLFIEDSYR